VKRKGATMKNLEMKKRVVQVIANARAHLLFPSSFILRGLKRPPNKGMYVAFIALVS
jgi:hypothetical protein